MANCKFCNEGGLTWYFNALYKKWELRDKLDNKHKCIIKGNKAKSSNKTEEFRRDPKIEKALKEFKDTLDKNTGKKIYRLNSNKKYEKK